MVIKKITVQLQSGLNARHTVEFVRKAYSFDSQINIIKNRTSASGRDLIGIMNIAVEEGETITLIADGSDEQVAADVLENFLLNKASSFFLRMNNYLR